MTTQTLSTNDLTDPLNLPDAMARLKACVTDGQFAAWARMFGEAAIEALEEFHARGAGFDDWGGEY